MYLDGGGTAQIKDAISTNPPDFEGITLWDRDYAAEPHADRMFTSSDSRNHKNTLKSDDR